MRMQEKLKLICKAKDICYEQHRRVIITSMRWYSLKARHLIYIGALTKLKLIPNFEKFS